MLADAENKNICTIFGHNVSLYMVHINWMCLRGPSTPKSAVKHCWTCIGGNEILCPFALQRVEKLKSAILSVFCRPEFSSILVYFFIVKA